MTSAAVSAAVDGTTGKDGGATGGDKGNRDRDHGNLDRGKLDRTEVESSNIDEIIFIAYGEDKECQSDT